MDIRDASALERTTAWLDELIRLCRRLGPVYTRNPKLSADVTRKAKALQTSLATLRAFLDRPEPPSLPERSDA